MKIMKKSLFLAAFALLFSACASKTTTASSNYSYTNYNTYTSLGYKSKADYSDKFNLNKFHGTRIGGDCSGLITAINERHNNAIFNPSELNKYFKSGRKSQAMFNLYKDKNQISYDEPQVGDLVFFNNTTRQTKGAKNKELITHVGIVSKVKEDGTVEFLHNVRGKNIKSVMNLDNPDAKTKGKTAINDYIIARCKSASCLTSNRFSGFGKVSSR